VFSLVFNPRNSALCLRLKIRSGLAGNQNPLFLDGHWFNNKNGFNWEGKTKRFSKVSLAALKFLP
jgi:hypothetical protein